MNEQARENAALIEEISILKKRIQELEQAESERKRIEVTLQESEVRYRRMVEMANEGIWEMDDRFNIIFVNRRMADMLGYLSEEMIGQTPDSFMFEEDIPNHLSRRKTRIDGAIEVYERRFLRKDGTTCWTLVAATPLHREMDKFSGAFAIFTDITERKRAEEALKKSEETAKRLARENELVAEIGRIVSSTLDIDEVYEGFAEKVREIIPFDNLTINILNTRDNTRTFRYTSGINVTDRKVGDVIPLDGSVTEKMVRTRLNMLINTNDKEDLLRQFPGLSRTITSGIRSTLGIALISKDEMIGILFFRSMKPNAYTEEDLRLAERVGSQIAGAIAHAQLFLERKQMEAALRQAEENFRRSLDQSPLGVRIWSKDGKTLYANQALLDIYGYDSFDELFATPRRNLYTPESYAAYQISAEKRRQGEDAQAEYERRIVRKDGEGRHLQVFRQEVLWNGEQQSQSISMDITERKRLEAERLIMEERLHRSEKMEALGTLAGGVAHDLNNVLGVLMGYSELLMQKIPEGNTLRIYIDNILKSTEKGASIIQDLLTLARRGVTVSEVINLNGVLSSFLKSPVFEKLQAYHPRVSFRSELDMSLLNIKGSPIHLEKTVMNLISNAAEAIAESGEVTIRTENRYVDKDIPGYDQVQAGEYAVLMVSDNGGGIQPADLGKIFEPFYTKKVMGRSGTGLGLAVIWGTVKDHNGYIDVQSEYGKGSTFTLYFPVTREEAGADLQKIPVEQYQGRGESILVVDDVQEQREMAAMMLTRLGYQVRTVSRGEEAVAYLKENTVDLLVLDMIMDPGIDGLETYRRVREINPDQKAILVSGFSETDRVKTAQELGAGVYVKKPYLMEKIGMAVRNELDRSA